MEKSKYPHSQRVNPITMQSPGPQFPSKYGALPSIQNRNSPIPTKDNQVVPMDHSFDAEPEERLRHLETRVNVTEKSNRALLEEVVRLQSELKTNVRRSEDVLREERQTRLQLENSLRASNDLIAQLSSRLKRTEDKIAEERMAISALVNHTKSVEQAVLGSQQELVSRKEAQTARLQEMKEELEEVSRAKDQLERLTFNLVDEMRQLKGRMDNQNMDFASVANDLKNKNKRLEEENRQTLESVRKHAEVQSLSDSTSSQLRQQIESRLSELRDVLVDLRGKQEGETQERRMLEQAVQKKISELMSNIAEQNRKREEAMHALDSIQREREHAAETERIKLQGKIAETAEEVSKKILQKEIKLREESQEKFNMVEKLISNEQSARMAFESDLRRELDKRWDSVKKSNEGDLQAVKQAQKLERAKTSETLHKLDEAVDLLQGQIEQYKKQQEKLLSAEIKSRKTHERDTREKVENLQEKLGIATSTLQAAVGGIMTKLQTESDRLKKEMKSIAEEEAQKNTRLMADLDTRVTGLNSKISNVEDSLEAKITGSSAAQAQNMREKVESISLWQDVTSQSIRDIQYKVQELPMEVYQLQEKHELLKSDLTGKVTAEAESRKRDVENLRRDLSRLVAAPGKGLAGDKTATKSDFDACQESLHKLAESVQTIKTVLGMKIATESKLRETSIASMEREIDRLKAQVYRWSLQETLKDSPQPHIDRVETPPDWNEPLFIPPPPAKDSREGTPEPKHQNSVPQSPVPPSREQPKSVRHTAIQSRQHTPLQPTPPPPKSASHAATPKPPLGDAGSQAAPSPKPAESVAPEEPEKDDDTDDNDGSKSETKPDDENQNKTDGSNEDKTDGVKGESDPEDKDKKDEDKDKDEDNDENDKDEGKDENEPSKDPDSGPDDASGKDDSNLDKDKKEGDDPPLQQGEENKPEEPPTKDGGGGGSRPDSGQGPAEGGDNNNPSGNNIAGGGDHNKAQEDGF